MSSKSVNIKSVKQTLKSVKAAPAPMEKKTSQIAVSVGTSVKQKPIMRNVYESVGGAVPQPSPSVSTRGKEPTGGSGKAKVVNRGGYEAITSADIAGQKPTMDTGYQVVGEGPPGPPAKLSAAPSPATDEASSGSYDRRRKERRRRQEEMMRRNRKIQMLMVGCSMLIFGTLIAGAIAFGVYLLSGGEEERSVLFIPKKRHTISFDQPTVPGPSHNLTSTPESASTTPSDELTSTFTTQSGELTSTFMTESGEFTSTSHELTSTTLSPKYTSSTRTRKATTTTRIRKRTTMTRSRKRTTT